MNFKIKAFFLTIILIIILMTLILPNLLFTIAKNSFGFFNGYSTSKFIYFIFLLVLLITIPTYNKIKNKNYFKNFNKNKNLDKKLVAIFLILITLSTISTISFQSQNKFTPFTLAYIIYDDDFEVFTGTSITHSHTFKPVIGLVTNFLTKGEFDVAQSIPVFMPNWINLIYFIGLILLILFIYLAIIYSHNFFLEKNIDYFGSWIFIASFYLVSKTIVDGGILTVEFLVGSVFFIWIILFYKKNYSKRYFILLTSFVFLIDFLVRYFLVSNSGTTLNNIQIVNLVIKGIVTVSGLFFFIVSIGAIIYFLTEKKSNKKILGVILLVIIGFISFTFAFNELGIEKAINQNDLYLINEIIPAKTTIAFVDYAIDPNIDLEIISKNNELVFAKLKEDSSISQLSIWKENIKAKDYIFPWKNSCAIPIIEKEIIINTKNELEKIVSKSSIFVLNEEKIGETTYKLKILHSKCITDIRGVLVEYLKSRGAKQFIVYN